MELKLIAQFQSVLDICKKFIFASFTAYVVKGHLVYHTLGVCVSVNVTQLVMVVANM